MWQERVRVVLPLALLNIFVLVAGVVVRDIVVSRPPEPTPRPLTVAEVGTEQSGVDDASIDSERLAELLDDRMTDSGGGEGLAAYVADAQTGDPLYGRDADDAAVPASTTKIATGVAVLAAVGPDERIDTTVVRGERDDEVILVGQGDPTLTETRDPGAYPRLPALEELAEDTARRLQADGVDTVDIGYDDSAFTGSDTGPGWQPNYVTEGSVAPVHALMIDTGRLDRDERYGERAADPPLAAAEAFARQLEAAGLTVRGDPTEREAAEGAETLAQASSAPISALVEIMMTESENNVAEALAFQVALARGGEASFADAGPALEETLAELGVDGLRLSDGSGLSVNNRISPTALVELLLLASDPERAELAPTVTGLPVAHFNGTLSDRYSPQSEAAEGAGWVHAKTGTLSGVSTLAGIAADADGRLRAFAFMDNDPAATGSRLDALAATLVECQC
ncbi:D-alanyl-D-alanine carboxypeptidase/D-alanyl-D-alanine-endopeptidase [Spiractinospora alimapuensis]|uniref:D-alanyl-D-alanine carboxypeptidase/D-alanyl-D-alanine endopeptidase n=1 Tax=Spiractinospora alimapuensis TaxID=2820884 RepID=UPI001F46ADD0|nr:D-alanyl-D-alanine carboxypeptidase/D-alanyl-D-alanine-endopeptidase [Spiractinospora alimapuensis]QVQ50950.1 D-alanyl-D-alanine carboxypeptidase/D-alanyl-D-alanine-endopeptidase [Spiractinospora alimapuensis]